MLADSMLNCKARISTELLTILAKICSRFPQPLQVRS